MCLLFFKSLSVNWRSRSTTAAIFFSFALLPSLAFNMSQPFSSWIAIQSGDVLLVFLNPDLFWRWSPFYWARAFLSPLSFSEARACGVFPWLAASLPPETVVIDSRLASPRAFPPAAAAALSVNESSLAASAAKIRYSRISFPFFLPLQHPPTLPHSLSRSSFVVERTFWGVVAAAVNELLSLESAQRFLTHRIPQPKSKVEKEKFFFSADAFASLAQFSRD